MRNTQLLINQGQGLIVVYCSSVNFATNTRTCFKYIVWQVCNRQIYVSACNGWEGPMWCHFRLICTTCIRPIQNTQVPMLCSHLMIYVRTYVRVYVCVYLPYVCMCSYACLCVCMYIYCSKWTCTQYGTYVCVCALSVSCVLSVYLSSLSCPSSTCLPSSSHLPPTSFSHLSTVSCLPPTCPMPCRSIIQTACSYL